MISKILLNGLGLTSSSNSASSLLENTEIKHSDLTTISHYLASLFVRMDELNNSIKHVADLVAMSGAHGVKVVSILEKLTKILLPISLVTVKKSGKRRKNARQEKQSWG